MNERKKGKRLKGKEEKGKRKKERKTPQKYQLFACTTTSKGD